MKDKANTFLYFTLLEFALANSDNPGKLGQSITLQLRELVGGKAVVMYYFDNVKQQFELMSVSPERRRTLIECDEIYQLAKSCQDYEGVTMLRKDDSGSSASKILSELNVNETISVPLLLKGQKIGLILIHDIFSESGIETILSTLDQLTEIFAMTVKNSMSFQSLEELNHAKDKFFSIIAHDLKGAFNSLLGFSELLLEDINKKRYENTELYAKSIYHTSNTTYDLLQNLLEWARNKTGSVRYKPQNIDLNELICHVIELNEHQALTKKIQLKQNLVNKIQLYADRNMIETILRNLISNAIKFSYENGTIVISAFVCNDGIQVEVSDDGIGISPENVEGLFEIGNVNSTSGTADEKGTGLGLILCKEFVEEHQGKIWIKSEIGKGSTFYFSIPNSTANHTNEKV